MPILFSMKRPREWSKRQQRRVIAANSWVVALFATAAAAAASTTNAEDSQSSAATRSSSSLGYRSTQPFCRKNAITVSAMYITCNSPGAYYYGSGGYRNSEVCMSGDKLNLTVLFNIPGNLEYGVYPSIMIESGLYNHFQTVLSSSLCLLPVTPSNGGETECPSPGQYTLETSFTVPSIRDSSFHYTPDIRLTFTDESNNRIGCSTSGTQALSRDHAQAATRGLVALCIALFLFGSIFGTFIYLSYRRKKRLEQMNDHNTLRAKNYHYFRTLPTGQVVPIRRPGTAAPRSHQQPRQEAAISNPSYNEPKLPTRPIPII